MRHPSVLAFLIPAAVAACGGDADRADAGATDVRAPAVVESGGEDLPAWTFAPDPLADIAALGDAPLDLLSAVGAAEQAAWRHALDAASFPAQIPPVAGLVAGAGGEVWVREAQPPSTLDGGVRWTVFAADGRPQARLTVPPRYTLWQAGHDWMLGGYTAPDGSERVRLYRIARR